MKKQLLYLSFLSIIAGVFQSCNESTEGVTESIPELYEEKGDGPGGKNRAWTAEEAQRFSKSYSTINHQTVAGRAQSESGSFANGELLGEWKNKGPFNMPGAFQFCEMDEGTDTVYTVTCGHYGGVQFIWKGTLDGDEWENISPKHPFRFEDLIVIPNGTKRRVIAGRQEDKLMYSDNGGKQWTFVAGLSGIKSTIVNRQDNNVVYSATDNKVFKSTDNGSTFQELESFSGAAANVRLYSPRWDVQPDASDVYLIRDGVFSKLNSSKTSFEQVGTVPVNGRIAMSGDSRKLWVVLNNRKWYASTNGGNSFSFVPTKSIYYGSPYNDMEAGQFFGVSPEDPNILIAGYAHPVITKDAGVTNNLDAKKYWGHYQNSIDNDPKVRVHYHPDFQSSQFFYDKSGTLISLRSSDGGIMMSKNEWIKDGFPTYDDIQGVYYNISLFNKPTQETYRGGFMYGYLNPDHLSCGTQDQGWQDTRSSTYGDQKLYWNQIGGGDGPCCITGDGKIGWSYDYFGKQFKRIELYDGATFKGQKGQTSAAREFTFSGGSYFTPSVGDWQDGNRIWVLSKSLRKIEYNVSNQQIYGEEDLFGGGSSYIQGLAQSRVDANLVFTMRDGNVYKSTNRGDDWSEIATDNETGITGFDQCRGMAWASPVDKNKVLFAAQSGTAVKTVYSEDGGSTWQNVTGSGDNLFPAAEVNGMAGSKDGSFVFASTNMGPYVFSVTTKKWHSLIAGTNLPVFWGQIVHCVDYGDKEIVHFSTWGQGIWSFEIKESLLANDINVKSLYNVIPENCGAAIAPSVVIENKGTDVLTSFVVKLKFDGVVQKTINKSGLSLAKGESVTVTFAESVMDIGKAEVSVTAEMPNGKTDELLLNNELRKSVTVTGGVAHRFSIDKASANNSLSFVIKDGASQEIVTKQETQAQATGSKIMYDFCLVPGCYSIEIENAFKVGCDAVDWDVNATYSGDGAKGAGKGEVVHYNGKKYRALWWASGTSYTPGTSSAWKDLGVCVASNPSDKLSLSETGSAPYFEISVENYSSPETKNFCVDQILTVDKTNKEWITSVVNVYPNPFSDFLTISPKEGVVSWELLDTQGKRLRVGQASQAEQLDLSHLTKGIYFVNIIQAQRNVTMKVVKE